MPYDFRFAAPSLALLLPSFAGCSNGADPPFRRSEPKTVQPIVVEDFERGPGRQTTARDCINTGFDGNKPVEGAPNCDWPGLSPMACAATLYCEGCNNFGECLDYLGRDEQPFAGEYSLRIHYDLRKADPCNGENSRAFGGVLFWVANEPGAPETCPAEHEALDLTDYEFLSLQVRAGTPGVTDAEIALHEKNGRETDRPEVAGTGGKVLISEYVDSPLPMGRWKQVFIPVCELLKTKEGNLNRSNVRGVVVGFARTHFEAAGTYSDDIGSIDVDDITFHPCDEGGCEACD